MNNSDQADDTDPIAAALAHQKELQEAGKSLEKRRHESFARLERFVCRAIQLWQSCNAATESTDGSEAAERVAASLMSFAACIQEDGWNERQESEPRPLPDDAIIERNPDGTIRSVVLPGRPPHTYRVVENLFPGSYGETLVGPPRVVITYDSIDHMRSQNHPSKPLKAVICIVTAALNGDREYVDRSVAALVAAKGMSNNILWMLGNIVAGSILDRFNVYEHELQKSGWSGKRKDHVYSADIDEFRKDVISARIADALDHLPPATTADGPEASVQESAKQTNPSDNQDAPASRTDDTLGDATEVMVRASEEAKQLRESIAGIPAAIQAAISNVIQEGQRAANPPKPTGGDPLLTRGEKTAGGAPLPKRRKRRAATANELMLAELNKDTHAVSGLTVAEWAKRIKKSPATVVATSAWKNLKIAREQLKAEKAVSRRKNGKRM